MPTTYEPIATTTLSSAASSVTFSSISGSYTDLVLVSNLKPTANTTSNNIRFNGDTGSNYSSTYVYGDGGTAGSGRISSSTYLDGIFDARTAGNTFIMHIMNYSNTTTFKTIIARDSNTTYVVRASVGLWRSTSAITSIYLAPGSSQFDAGATFTLYGIKAA
jgi:hypothetical protein